jgi:hypothetical protein
MPAVDIDFRNLRKHRNSLNDGFEELTRQLVLADPPLGYTDIENRGPGADGGVEVLVRFSSDRVWGWQSKFFDGFDNSEVAQLRTSFSAALSNYPGLERYVVAIPRNLSGSAEGDNNTQRRKWIDWKKWATDKATKLNRTVEIELWDDTIFVQKLQSTEPRLAGIRAYWFNEDVLTPEWVRGKFDAAKDRIGNRYTPEDHVELEVRKVFDVVTRDEALVTRMDSFKRAIGEAEFLCTELSRHSEPSIQSAAGVLLGILQELSSEILPGRSKAALASLGSAVDSVRGLVRGGSALKALRDTAAEPAERAREADNTDDRADTGRVQNTVAQIGSHLSGASHIFSTIDSALLRARPLLVLGEAGSGKTHLLADEVARHLERGAPAIFVPARALHNVDQPGRSILEYLDTTGTSFDDWLGTLSAAANATGLDALVAIDGINESATAEDWEASLPVLLREVAAFSNIKIVVSCRTAYRVQCIRENLDVVQIHHPGFEGSLSEAAKTYLDNNGIERSSAPIFELSGILNNPLFLTSVVRGLKREGRTSFPRDLDSLPKILGYWVKSVERSLIDRRYERIQLGDGKLEDVVRALAAEMARKGKEELPMGDANSIAEAVIDLGAPARPADRIVVRLLEEGLLLDFPSKEAGGKTVSFSFQQFGDYFIADAIMQAVPNAEELISSLLPSGPFAHVFDKGRQFYFAGIRVALLALCPARFGVELPHASKLSGQLRIAVSDFLDSVPRRDAKALTARTVRILEGLRDPPDGEPQQIDDRNWFDLLAKIATVPGSALNADYLKRHLESIPCPQRDATWSLHLVNSLEEYQEDSSPLLQIVDWAWNAPVQDIESEQVRLAAVALGLMTSTMDRGVRDRATKALASLLAKYASVVPSIIETFSDWDDSYVRERILAAALTGTLACRNDKILLGIASAVDRMVFSKAPVERHAWTRRFGELIIDYVSGLVPTFDSSSKIRATPPYTSEAITTWPSLNDVAAHKNSASSIVHSVVGYLSDPLDNTHPRMAGDFGRYTMGGVDDHFSSVPRALGLPRTRNDEIQSLLSDLRAIGEATSRDVDELGAMRDRLAQIEQQAWRKVIGTLSDIDENDDVDVQEDEDAEEGLSAAIANKEEEMLADIPNELVDRYELVMPFGRHRSGGIPKFSLLQAQCWVVQRCLDLGWTEKVHGEVEKHGLRYTHDRNGHAIERIGKKYQHIAFQELVGYLADHHWYLEYDVEPAVLDRVERFKRPQIDPTFLAGEFSRECEGYDPGGLRRPALKFSSSTLEEDLAWTLTSADLPDIESWLVQRGNDGLDWAIVNSFVRSEGYMTDFESPTTTRSGQLGIELVLVPLERWADLDVLDREVVRDSRHDVFRNQWSTDRLYGLNSARGLVGKARALEFEDRICGVPYARLTDTFSPSSSEYDYSGVADEASFFIPKPPVIATLGLEPKSLSASYFVDATGRPAFACDVEMLEEWCVMRYDLVEQFASANGLGVTWRVWFEKDGGISSVGAGGGYDQFARHDHLGYFRKAADGWQGAMVPFRD